MKTRLLIVLLAASILSGCYANMRFYPVQGPLSTQTPLPVLVAKITGAARSGDISLTLADGEVCKGAWKRVPQVHSATGATTTNASPASAMASLWDTVYGPGFYVAHVLGAWSHGTAVVTGDRGTVLNVEFYSGDEHGARGVAKDNKGNIYKVLF